MAEDDEEQVVEILGQLDLRPEASHPQSVPKTSSAMSACTLPPGHPNA